MGPSIFHNILSSNTSKLIFVIWLEFNVQLRLLEIRRVESCKFSNVLANIAIVIFMVNFFGGGDESFHINLEVGGEWEMEARLDEKEGRSVIQRGVATWLRKISDGLPRPPTPKQRTLKTATGILAETLKTVQIRSGLFPKAEVIPGTYVLPSE
jgi:hypothetical protein